MLNHFLLQMNKMEQEVYILQHGVWLMSRQEPKYHIYLYSLHNFYVELIYHQKNSSVAYLRVFQTTEFLEPYLCQIDIKGLFNLLN